MLLEKRMRALKVPCCTPDSNGEAAERYPVVKPAHPVKALWWSPTSGYLAEFLETEDCLQFTFGVWYFHCRELWNLPHVLNEEQMIDSDSSKVLQDANTVSLDICKCLVGIIWKVCQYGHRPSCLHSQQGG